MRSEKVFAVLVLFFVLVAWSVPIVQGAQYLTVSGQDVSSITLELGQSRTVEIVSTDGTSYVDYAGFDNGFVLGAFSYLETRKEAGNLATAIEYDQPTFYGYYVNATGISPPPSAGVHFIFKYTAQQVGETDLKLYDSTLTSVIDLVHITVIPLQPVPIGTAWTYQGRLIDSNSPADGFYDFQFKLYNNPDPIYAVQQGITIDIDDLDVIDGYFTVEFDFGSGVFDGDARWLEINVRPGDSDGPNDFVTISPRQEVMPTPYALQTRGIYVDDEMNIGMGTTSPKGKLHVDGGKAADDTDASDIKIEAQDGGDALRGLRGGRGGNIILLPGDGGTSPPLTKPGPSGKIGIGTAGPETMLDVRGDIQVDQKIQAYDSGGLELATDEGTTRIFVADDGKVGMGTNTPRASLEVTNTGNSHAIWASTSDIPVYAHRTSTGGTWPAVAGDCNSQASNASGVRGRILSTSPGSLGAGVYGYNYGTGSNGVGVRGHHAGNGYAGYFTGGKNYFEGNVGIGTKTPSEKLDVEGNIDVSSNRVKNYKGFPRPDYDSGWVSIAQNQSLQFLHNIGGDPDDYVVDVQGKDLEGMGVNIHGLGGYVDTGATYSVREGFYWYNLTSSYIRVLRLKENTSADQVRVRIWVYN